MIFVSLIIGIASSFLIIQENITLIAAGSILLFFKNVLDKVDGSLARAKGLTSRRGRFYDSITDFIVNVFVYTAIAYKLNSKHHDITVIILTYAALLSSMLQTSFFIFYQVSFIKSTGKETINRLNEKITAEDIIQYDKFTILLQRIFNIIYGWQDRFFIVADKILVNRIRNGHSEIQFNKLWYRDRPFLTTISLLPIGTHIFVISYAAIIRNFEGYLILNLILLNLLLCFSMIYHYYSFKIKIKSSI